MRGDFWTKRRKKQIKFVRDQEEKETARKTVNVAQDEEQGLEQEIKELYSIWKHSEGQKLLKAKMRSQTAVEDILTGS